MLVTDWTLGEQRLVSAVRAVCSLGPRVGIQHRHPEANTKTFLAEARLLAAVCTPQRNPLFVNGRLDVALLVGAHLHLPVDGATPADVRPFLPAGRWVSAAVHNQAELARAKGADLVLLSPVFPPASKLTDARPTLGAEGYARLRALAPCPALALGGIHAMRLRNLGAVEGVAVQSAVLRAEDPGRAAAELLSALGGPTAPPEPVPPAG